jgi:hypothetical protein
MQTSGKSAENWSAGILADLLLQLSLTTLATRVKR